MLQDQSRNRTPMPHAQQAGGAARSKPRRARAEVGIARMLSAPELPAPGSPEAMAAFRSACKEFDRRTHISDEEFDRLRIGDTLILWTADKVRSAIEGDFSSAASSDEAVAMASLSRADLQYLLVLTLRRDLQFEEAIRDTQVSEFFALAYPEESGPRKDTDEADDPILSVISDHKAAYAAWLPQLRILSDTPLSDPIYADLEAASEEPRDREQEAYGAVTETLPTTLTGLVALADYLPGAVLRNGCVQADDDALNALGAICSAVKEFARTNEVTVKPATTHTVSIEPGSVSADSGKVERDGEPATIENLSGLDFPAYDGVDSALAGWKNKLNQNSLAMGLVDRLLAMSKKETVAFLQTAEAESGANPGSVYDVLDASQKTFEGWSKLLHLTTTRFLVAGSTLAMEQRTESEA